MYKTLAIVAVLMGGATWGLYAYHDDMGRAYAQVVGQVTGSVVEPTQARCRASLPTTAPTPSCPTRGPSCLIPAGTYCRTECEACTAVCGDCCGGFCNLCCADCDDCCEWCVLGCDWCCAVCGDCCAACGACCGPTGR